MVCLPAFPAPLKAQFFLPRLILPAVPVDNTMRWGQDRYTMSPPPDNDVYLHNKVIAVAKVL